MKFFNVLVFFFLIHSCLFGQNQSEIKLDSAVRYGKLSNGFTYYIYDSNNSEEQTELRFVTKAGSLHETKDQLGLAHLLEHMAFRSLQHFPEGGIWSFFERHGMPRGSGAVNGSAGQQQTYYTISLKNSQKYLLDSCLLIMRDWAGGILLRSEEVNAERSVLISEIREGLSSQVSIAERIDSFLLRRRIAEPAFKCIENYKSFELKSLTSFYQDWYRADRQAVIITGDVNVVELEQEIKKLFSDLKPSSTRTDTKKIYKDHRARLDGTSFLLKQQNSKDEVTVRIVAKRYSKNQISGNKNLLDYRMRVLNHLYKIMINDRLNVFNEQSTSSQVMNMINLHFTKPHVGVDVMDTHVTLNNFPVSKHDFQDAMRNIEAVKRYGFTQEELDNAKELERKQYDLNKMQSARVRAGRYVEHFVDHVVTPNPCQEYQLINDFIEKISLKEINEMAATWLKQTKDVDIIIAGPDKEIVQLSNAIIRKWIAEVDQLKIDPVQFQVRKIPELIPSEKIPVANNNLIAHETLREGINLRELRLTNGITVVLKSLNSKGDNSDKIFLEGFNLGGYMNYTGTDREVARISSRLINICGVGGLDKVQLKQYLADKGITAGPFMTPEEARYSGVVGQENFESLIQYAYLTFCDVNKDSTAFEKYVTQQLSAGKDSVLLKVGFKRVRSFFKENFLNAPGFTFVITGNFDLDQYQDITVKYLGSIPFMSNAVQKEKVFHSKDQVVVKSQPKVEKVVTKGSQLSSNVRIKVSGNYEYTDSENLKLEVLNNLLGNSLMNRLREKEGGTYSAQSHLTVNNKINYLFDITFETDVKKVDYMITAAIDEIARIQEGKFSPEEFEKALAFQRSKYTDNLESNQFWLKYLTNQYQNHADPNAILNNQDMLNKMTARDLKDTAEKYLKITN